MTVDFHTPVFERTRIVSLVTADRSVKLAKRLGCTKERVFDHAELGPFDVWRHPAQEALQ